MIPGGIVLYLLGGVIAVNILLLMGYGLWRGLHSRERRRGGQPSAVPARRHGRLRPSHIE
jgi:hypothetical protein